MASAIAARQDESELSRRKLVEKSKEFKKTSSEEVRHQVSSLMKAFQSEVREIRIGQDHVCRINICLSSWIQKHMHGKHYSPGVVVYYMFISEAIS